MHTVTLAIVGIVWSAWPACGHEMPQGHHRSHHSGPQYSYLIGRAIQDGLAYNSAKKGEMLNCCTLGGNGDCRELSPFEIEEADAPDGRPGYRLLSDGEWIAREDATASPDGKMYRCKHEGKPSHCLFITEARG
jgi:hypothetical protein